MTLLLTVVINMYDQNARFDPIRHLDRNDIACLIN